MYHTALCSLPVPLPKVLNHHLLLFGVFSDTNQQSSQVTVRAGTSDPMGSRDLLSLRVC